MTRRWSYALPGVGACAQGCGLPLSLGFTEHGLPGFVLLGHGGQPWLGWGYLVTDDPQQALDGVFGCVDDGLMPGFHPGMSAVGLANSANSPASSCCGTR